MRKCLFTVSLLGILLTVGCASSTGPVKELNESSAKRMIAKYLNATHPQIGILFGPLLPYLIASHTAADYNAGKAGPYGSLLKQLVGQGFLSQKVYTMTVPEISGTFVRGSVEANGVEDEWILRSVPGTNELQGFAIWDANDGTSRYQGSGTIETDGTFNLSCASTTPWTCDDQGRGRYYEKGGRGYLQFPHYARALNGDPPYVGPATGHKVTATLYTYTMTPKFTALLKYNAGAPYVDIGNFDVEKVTNLRLDTDTQASADFTYAVSLNSTGRVFFPTGSLGAAGQVVFGKKPDGSWAIDSIAGVPHLRPISFLRAAL